ncbi:rhamnogalacturonan lyase family protein [Actinorugispora endophytica]|uniref:Cellulose binding domain-containing protein n=1 Tax=Actinorugispora endophytica TaxID=1605990 RepID=A0A4R6UQP6_9ACTN|nr:cellulose binding domain-containing protein [Actinorugispora endophytica]TDQ47585.1 cellulose binding domain-containing protein [Actinorugispora endophytica]
MQHRPPTGGTRRPGRPLAAAAALALCATAVAAAGGPASAAAGCRVDYGTSQWNNGFTASVDITNLGDPVDGWTLEWEFPSGERLTQGWGAEFASSGAGVTASNTSWNAEIATGATVGIGFNATHTGTVGTPSSFTLNGVVCTGGTGSEPDPDPDPDPGGTEDPDGARQTERLDRGLVSVRSGDGNLVSWRLLGGDPRDVAFNVYRGSTRLTPAPLASATSYLDTGAPANASYTVRPVVDGVEQAASPASLAFSDGYLDVPLQRPPGGSVNGSSYTYDANDASVGDLDGDGAYEIVLKWEPANAKDNSQSGYTGPVLIDAYELDGTRLWRLDLGRNIRAGAHYTQFQVYDYDGDGRAEVAMKTADGTRDGMGAVIGSASADHRNSSGYVLSGPEFLTVFDGRTGVALDTADYVPARGTVSSWGDSYGNRVDRFLAGTAYLDGERPSMVFSRGYYTRTVIAAWDFRDGRLTRRWTFDTNSSTNTGQGYDGQGFHSLSVADADGDGRDEVMFGAMAVDDDGTRMWTTRYGHGDALHVGDLVPGRSGLEVYGVSESASQPDAWLADARTGATIWRTASGDDNGRGVAGDVWSGSPGAEFWSSSVDGLLGADGSSVGRKPGSANFLAWWDGDPSRELLDQTRIDEYGPGGDTRLLTGSGVASNNGTKATPALSGDILGDWREEVVWRTGDSSALRIYSTPHATDRRLPTLMHDTQYRVAIAWQNTAYNQPPHPSFHIGDGMASPPWPDIHYP